LAVATASHIGTSGPPKVIPVTTKPVAALPGRLSVMTMLPPTGTLLPPAAIFGVRRKVLLPPVNGLPAAGTVMTLPTVRSPALRTLPEKAADGPEVPVAVRLKPPAVTPRTGKVTVPLLPALVEHTMFGAV